MPRDDEPPTTKPDNPRPRRAVLGVELPVEPEVRERHDGAERRSPPPPPKRSISPSPESGSASISPAEKVVRDAAWRWARKHLPAWALAVVLGGGSGYAGKGARDAAQDAELKAAKDETATNKQAVAALTTTVAELEAARKSERAKRVEIEEELAGLKTSQKRAGETHDSVHDQLRGSILGVQTEINAIRNPLRPPRVVVKDE